MVSKRKRDDIVPTYLWHLRLGHINADRINRLKRDGPLDFPKVELHLTCESCLQGKMTNCDNVLDLIHSDVCSPLNHVARGGFA